MYCMRTHPACWGPLQGSKGNIASLCASFFFISRVRVLVLSYEEKEFSIPSLMTPCLSLSSLFYCVSTSYLFHILIQKEITRLEEGCDAMEDFVRTNCVEEKSYRRIFSLRLVIKFTVWHVTNNVALIICRLRLRGAQKFHCSQHASHSASRPL